MVNTEEFIGRLEKVMQLHSLSASAFADKIGIQRSSLSHLLSGRNNPSLDFVMKVIKAFPDVDLYWLLNGTGDFAAEPDLSEEASPAPDHVVTSPDLFTVSGNPKNHKPDVPENPLAEIPEEEEDGIVEKIVVFYTDGSFKSYRPK